MTGFVLVLALCGIVATFFLNWVFLAVVGLVFVPVCVLTMVSLGTPLLSAVGQALLGYVVLQVTYCLAGWGMALVGSWRSRTGHPLDRTDLRSASTDSGSAQGGTSEQERGYGDLHASMQAGSLDRLSVAKGTPLQASVKLARSGSTSGSFPLFGGWLPLAAFYDPPCQADGSPWNGRNEPGYRMTILVVGWFNHAVSVRVGAPKPYRKPYRRQRSRSEVDGAVASMDERIRQSRLGESGTERSPPRDGS